VTTGGLGVLATLITELSTAGGLEGLGGLTSKSFKLSGPFLEGRYIAVVIIYRDYYA
jgi:hypothetical protein